MNVATLKAKVESLKVGIYQLNQTLLHSFPKVRLPRITMPWDRAINEFKKQIAELRYELGQYAERLEEVEEGVDERFDNCEFICRNEAEDLIEEGTEACVEDQLEQILNACDYQNSDEVNDAIETALQDATFEVAIRV